MHKKEVSFVAVFGLKFQYIMNIKKSYSTASLLTFVLSKQY